MNIEEQFEAVRKNTELINECIHKSATASEEEKIKLLNELQLKTANTPFPYIPNYDDPSIDEIHEIRMKHGGAFNWLINKNNSE